jgi:hypothetical protein
VQEEQLEPETPDPEEQAIQLVDPKVHTRQLGSEHATQLPEDNPYPVEQAVQTDELKEH